MPITIPFDPEIYGYTVATGTGAAIDFTIGFPYLQKSSQTNGTVPPFVRIYINSVELLGAGNWSVRDAGNVLRFVVAPADGAKIEMLRDSQVDDPSVSWRNQSPINQRNLQSDQDWNRFVQEEILLRLQGTVDGIDGIFGAQLLDDLNDVTLTTPTDGQVLQFDIGTGQWVNAIVGTFGPVAVDGTWRIIPIGNNLVVQRRESSVYVTKATFTP